VSSRPGDLPLPRTSTTIIAYFSGIQRSGSVTSHLIKLQEDFSQRPGISFFSSSSKRVL
jgi:hypothetical protein